jgi:aryl-alcohol dehydrogenase-like predicted oxidoreductase
MPGMRYRLLGNSGLRVSELALGTMTFSSSQMPRGDRPSPGADWSWCATEDDARRIFATYVERGGNFIDTADIYAGGTSEPLVGELIGVCRDQIVLATKFGLSTDDLDVTASGSSYRTMVRAVERSLRRLATDRIDLLWLHAWDGLTPIEEIARGLDALVRSGKVLYVGVSDTPAWAIATLQAATAAHGFAPITAVQLRYSVVDRAAELELLPMARHLGMGVAAFGALGGGALTDRHAADGPSRRDRATLVLRERDAAAAMRSVAARLDCSAAQVAIAWLRGHRQPVTPIVGARTPRQLDDALGALDVDLDDEAMAALDAVAPPPSLFPHDVIAAVRAPLRGGTRSRDLEVPPNAAF